MTALPGPVDPSRHNRLHHLADILGVPIQEFALLYPQLRKDVPEADGYAIASLALESGDISAALKGCYRYLLDHAAKANDNAVITALRSHADALLILDTVDFSGQSVARFIREAESALSSVPNDSRLKQCLATCITVEVALLQSLVGESVDAAARLISLPKEYATDERILGKVALLVIEKLASDLADQNKIELATVLIDQGLEIAANVNAHRSELLLVSLKAEVLTGNDQHYAALALLRDKENLLFQECQSDPANFYRIMLQCAELNLLCNAPARAQEILFALHESYKPELSTNPDYYISLEKSFALLYDKLGDPAAALGCTRDATRIAAHFFGTDSPEYQVFILECIAASVACKKFKLALRYCDYFERKYLKTAHSKITLAEMIKRNPDSDTNGLQLMICLYRVQALTGVFDFNGAVNQARKGIALFNASHGAYAGLVVEIYFNLAKNYLAQNNLEHCEAAYNSIKENFSGSPMATLLAELGIARASLVRHQQAEICERVAALDQQFKELCNDPGQSTIFSTMCTYAYALALQQDGKPAAAIDELDIAFRVLKGVKAAVPDDFTGDLHVSYMECLLAQGRAQDAASFAEAFLESERQLEGSALNPWSAKIMALLGQATYGTDSDSDDISYQAASRHLNAALEIYKKLRGNTENFCQEIKWVLNLLGSNAQSRGLTQEAQKYKSKAKDY